MLIQAFFKRYEQHQDDHIYAYTLVFNAYLSMNYIAVSTQRSIFAEDEDSANILQRMIDGMCRNGAIVAYWL